MKIGIIIPDRGDRPLFIKNCYRQLFRQTVWMEASAHIITVNDPPKTIDVDITARYREGYDRLRDRGLDVIAFIENDDWYSIEYLKVMVSQWEKAGRPDLFGTNYTIYWHMRLKKYFTMRHYQSAHMMNTLIKPDLKFEWPLDQDPFTDQWLWNHIKSRRVWQPDHIISIGMKHGVGKCGGYTHVDKLHRYINDDNGWLQNTIDAESFEFFNNYPL